MPTDAPKDLGIRPHLQYKYQRYVDRPVQTFDKGQSRMESAVSRIGEGPAPMIFGEIAETVTDGTASHQPYRHKPAIQIGWERIRLDMSGVKKMRGDW